MTLDALLPLLDHVTPQGSRYRATCPAHDDRTPSLQIAEGDKGLLVKCWAGCSLPAICESLGIHQKDLFFDTPTTHRRRRIPEPVKIDLAALAFRYEVAGLDRRLRAERVLQATHGIAMSELPDRDLDRLVDAVGQAYADIERAELFEHVADGLRAKAFAGKEGTVSHAA